MARFIDPALHAALADAAVATARGRSHRQWHDPARDTVQRFFVHMRPGTYVRPHCHALQQRLETTVVLSGRLDLLLYAADGPLMQRVALMPGSTQGVEIGPEEWHGFVVHEPSTLFEVKQGPYDPARDKRFADWAPAEGSPDVAAFQEWQARAAVGDRWPGVGDSGVTPAER